MDNKLLEKAVKTPTDVLKPVLDVVWSLVPVSQDEVVKVAIEVNRKLSYELFPDLSYEKLITHFSVVSRAVAHNALKN